jgi:hypothetical protein
MLALVDELELLKEELVAELEEELIATLDIEALDELESETELLEEELVTELKEAEFIAEPEELVEPTLPELLLLFALSLPEDVLKPPELSAPASLEGPDENDAHAPPRAQSSIAYGTSTRGRVFIIGSVSRFTGPSGRGPDVSMAKLTRKKVTGGFSFWQRLSATTATFGSTWAALGFGFAYLSCRSTFR